MVYNHKIYNTASPFWANKKTIDSQKFLVMFNEFSILPENIKDLTDSYDTALLIWQIGQNNKFKEEQIAKLAVLVWKLLTAEIPIARFIPDIAGGLNIPEETARAIAQEINIKIFSKAAMQIKRLHESKFKSENRNQNIEGKIQNAENRNHKLESQNFIPQTRKPEERIVNLQKPIDKKPEFVESGPKIEGNIVDLSN